MKQPRELPRFQRVSRRNPCPICGRNRFCSFNELVAVCTRVESDRPVIDGDGTVWGWSHSLRDLDVHIEQKRTVEHPAERFDIDLMDQTYRALLKHLTLTDEHKAFLFEKGCTESDIVRGGYASLPLEGRTELARKWLADCPWLEHGGVPGFCYRSVDGKQFPFIKGASGILHPALDVHNRIQGFQIRVDNPINGRYLWMSSDEEEYGCGSGTPYHLAKPSVLDRSKPLFVTEGIRKADIAAKYLNAMVIGVSGVNVWREALPVIQLLNPHQVVIAWDADWETNQWVRMALDAFLNALRESAIPVKRAIWPIEKGKGIDDVLVANHSIRIVS